MSSSVFGTAPTIGMVANAIPVFDNSCKEAVEKEMKALFDQLQAKGEISRESVYYAERTFRPLEMQAAVDRFVRAKVDAVVLLVSAFPNGNAFLTLASDPYLRHIPLIVVCPPEFNLPNREWTINAYCGTIMNNHVARRLGRPMFQLCGMPSDAALAARFRQHLAMVKAVRALRGEIIGRFGDAPSGFHSSGGDQIAYANMFGMCIEVMDLLGVESVYNQAKTKGFYGEKSFTEADVEATFKKMSGCAESEVDPAKTRKAARLFQAYKAIIEANGYTTVAIRCWPETMGGQFQIAQCLVLGWLMSENIVRAAACESDWTTAVSQSIAGVLTGQPSPCVDFVGDLTAGTTVQLAHCGVGIPRLMSGCKLSHIGPDRQVGDLWGPTCAGQYAYGPKTGISIIQDNGKFKMLAFTGENSKKTDRNMLISSADIQFKNHRRLNELIFQHGFPHHLALAFGDVTAELKLLCEFYGIEYLNPDEN